MFLSKAIVEPGSWEGSMLVIWNHLKLPGWGLRRPEFVQQWCPSAKVGLFGAEKMILTHWNLGGAAHIHPRPSHPLSKSLRIPSELWYSWAIAAAYAWGVVDVLPKIPKLLVNWIMTMVQKLLGGRGSGNLGSLVNQLCRKGGTSRFCTPGPYQPLQRAQEKKMPWNDWLLGAPWCPMSWQNLPSGHSATRPR